MADVLAGVGPAMTDETRSIPGGRPNTFSGLASEGRFQAYVPADDLAGSLRQVIKKLLCEGRPRIQKVAKISGLGVRTLQRRLSSGGLSYSDLVQQARCELAWDLLADSDAKVIDVALETGYQDPSNFSRAFRRWWGTSPSRFRKHPARRQFSPDWPRPAAPNRSTPRANAEEVA